ncbi:LeuA family protein [Picrophilus oshimae]|uniref:2-isopropylmalate synthase n=1 Tax=Picrophilus torridus (strain ATCC 700027 / DSM 9790 / JCM 10055 / NBRC 100828 / KAW 2/3) TaxID=1122961 RepID=Q6L0K4_PICTO|nr:trans-homoaconitate synthase [Picrophilus oshimae]AAT43498.1 2-isopropylmalate synthase [Picrophilus oshimae DSM 9789]
MGCFGGGYARFFHTGMHSRLGLNSVKKRIRIFDTTLRDGEQSPGVSFNINQKARIAGMLVDLGVDMIETGFAAVSSEESMAIRKIHEMDGNFISLARCNRHDIDSVIDTGIDNIHLFIATSDIHIKYKLKTSRENIMEKIVDSIDYARSHGLNVLFSPEDATRTDMNFLIDVINTAISSGAYEINIPDTIGIMNPISMYNFIHEIKNRTKSCISVHCHNDFGMATANTLAAIMAGADGAQVTVNGIGERAGNAALEEVVLSVHAFTDCSTGINMRMIPKISKYVSMASKMYIQKNKAIVGENAFSHESGIHVHGLINNPETYEPIDPGILGLNRRIVLGKHSGTTSLKYILESHGIKKSDDEISGILVRIKDMNIYDENEILKMVR